MSDLSLLKERIDDSGMTMVAVAKKAGIRRATLYNRLNGKGEFTASEIMGLMNTLNLSKPDREKIFFSKGSM